jgi:four helix bundle protein
VKINSFTELKVWQKAHELTLFTYALTERFPRSDQFGLVSQMRRSAASVPANIAEGFGRRTTRELLRSLQIARGELAETRYFMILSRDLGRISKTDVEKVTADCDAVGQLINALARSLQGRLKQGQDSRITNHESQITFQG